MAESQTSDDRVVAATLKYFQMLEDDVAIDIQDFLDEYPEIADQLKPSLEGLAAVHQASLEAKHNIVRTQASAEGEDNLFPTQPIGDFQILRELGRGGMGIVYEAIQISLGRRVALKILPFANALDSGRLQRFQNEAHAAAHLHHANIVTVYAVGSDRGVQYYAMQFIDGQTVAEVLAELRRRVAMPERPKWQESEVSISQLEERGPDRSLPPEELADNRAVRAEFSSQTSSASFATNAERNAHYRLMVRLVLQATAALEHAHQYGVVHRDIKPGNLLLDAQGKIWVTDFGLAQIEHNDSNLTRSGDAVGTARYMSPEQATGDRILMSSRSDIYSLGITLYEMLTLQPAIQGNDYRDLLNSVVECNPPSMRVHDPFIPNELVTIVNKAISKDPADRYATAEEFGKDLDAWLNDKPIMAQPPNIWQRLEKWRRRNHQVFNTAAMFLAAATLGLLATTLIVLREKNRTELALDSERRERLSAEASYKQARLAVDTFTRMSEAELGLRPELQSLRRRFLETSLAFYEEFLRQRAKKTGQFNDESKELAIAAQNVERIVQELELLDDLAPLLLLADLRVRQEIRLSDDLEDLVTQHVYRVKQQLAEDNSAVVNLPEGSEPSWRYVKHFASAMKGLLSDIQLNRLRQIARQKQLPFTFLSKEVGDKLALTTEQLRAISQVIQEGRPDRSDRERPPFPEQRHRMQIGPRREWDKQPPPTPPKDAQVDFSVLQDAPPEKRETGEDWKAEVEQAASTTVERVLTLLSEEQKKKWGELIGAPYPHHVHWRLESLLPE